MPVIAKNLNGFILICFALFGFSMPTLSVADNRSVTVYFFVDGSASMEGHQQRLSQAADVFAQTLQKRCGKYQIAVSTISYDEYYRKAETDRFIKNTENAEARVFGQPKYLTQNTPNGASLLKLRIAGQSAPSQGMFTREITYSSIPTVLAQERDIVRNSRYVATVMITDAVPTYEQYKPREALNEIAKYVPLSRFSSYFIVHPSNDYDLWHQGNYDEICSIDSNLGVPEKDTALAQTYNNLARESYGGILDICSEQNGYIEGLKQIVNEIVNEAGCQALM